MRLSRYLRQAKTEQAGTVLLFRCPGCQSAHAVCVERGTSPSPVWGYNHLPHCPTFTPSIFVKGIKPGVFDDPVLANAYKITYQEGGREAVLNDPRFRWWCHSFVTDGQIQFLSDCSHPLAGKTVQLDDWPEES